MENKFNIKNLSENAMKYKYIIGRLVDEDVYYYGADNLLERAVKVATRINGIIFANF